MDPEELKEITKAANAAVADLDPELKAVAFQTILNKLLGEGVPVHRGTKRTKAKAQPRAVRRRSGASAGPVVEIEKITQKLLTGISRSKHHGIVNLPSIRDKALYVLQIAKDEQDVDGLTPPQISKILDQVFRVRATPQAISMALMNALKLVDRKPSTHATGGLVYAYRIMHDGEEHLKAALGGPTKKGK